MKLHLGCGKDYLDGYNNCDISENIKPDTVLDLENKLPFEDSTVSEIIANHVMEHIHNFVPLMHEIHRVCIGGAVIKIKTPFYSAWGQFNDPTHVRFFTPFTFDYFKIGEYSHEVACENDMFDVRMVKINFGVGISSKLNWLFNPIINISHRFYCRFFAWVFPSAEIQYELVVIKNQDNASE